MVERSPPVGRSPLVEGAAMSGDVPRGSRDLARARSSLRLARGAAVVLVALGAVVLSGWVFDVPALRQVVSGSVSTKVNMAVAFVLLGAALWLLGGGEAGRGGRRHLVGGAAAGVVSLVGGVVLVQYVFAVDLGIDELLYTDAASAENPFPGRPAASSAVCLVLLGTALLALRVQSRRLGWWPQWLVLPAAGLALVAVVGYLLEAPALVGVADYTDMPLPTAVGVLVACIGVVAARPDRGLAALLLDDRAAGPVLRRLLPWTVLLPPLVGSGVTAAVQRGWVDSRLGVAIFTVTTMVGLSAVTVWLARPLGHLDAERRAAEASLRETAVQLELRVHELGRAREDLAQANDRLAGQNVQLGRANEELQRFAYVASHDLQEPLRKITSFSRLLEERLSDDLEGDARMYLERIVAAATRMQRLIEDLLMFSRAGRPSEVVPVDSAAALRAVVDSLAVRVAETGARVTSGDLPTVAASRTEIEQLLQNLVGNALKYRADDRPPHVHVEATEQDGGWRFTVADNGIGIEPAYAKRIFQIFQRLHPRGRYDGTGIGLAVCQRIVETHDGRIGVESVPGEGSTFWFTWPASAAPRRQEDPHDDHAPAGQLR
jgi:signal transduction histidine kinase